MDGIGEEKREHTIELNSVKAEPEPKALSLG